MEAEAISILMRDHLDSDRLDEALRRISYGFSKELKKIMQDENLTWRTFADDGKIIGTWGASTPQYFILDHKGVIRYKWTSGNPREAAIDAALDELLAEAE